MAIVVNMPRLSDTMEEGTVAAWLKKVGDKVEEGDILAEIETDKATMEFESFNEGTLLYIGVQEGETTKVDELLAIIGNSGEDISGFLNGNTNLAKSDVIQVADETKDVSDVNFADSPAQELPKGVIVVTMPRLSDTMEEGTVATWLKKVGDKVEEGDILAEIETDKATMEFESFQSGTLLEIGLKEGESAKVDALLAIIGPAGTDISGVANNFKASVSPKNEEAAPKTETKIEAQKTEPVVAAETKTITPKPTPVNANGRIFVSPLAKKLAEEKGINITNVKGSGEHGRIVKRDIENYTPA
ncbi:MAG: E3 binding domain-containing protein, partial [Flaviramulus sp.]|nr:E3 binding domain-containing protein [Flaviramulus sp.]